MAVRDVCQVGDDILRKQAKNVKNFDKSLWDLLDDMRDTMNANAGMGFAAPQVGILKRIIIVEANNMFLELINPVILKQSGKDIEEEGCLSVGTMRGYVERPMTVTVKAQDRFGYDFTITGEKYLARAICHEVDHLNGVLFIDKVLKNYGDKKSK